ncbi:Secreted protein [Pseudomonas sp. IT-P100]
MSVLGFWRGGIGVVQVAGQVNTLGDQEQQRHAQAAEDLEVDPVVLERERDEQVGGTAKQEERDPGDVQARPDQVRQGQRVAHDAFDQQLVTDEVAADERQRKQPVDHRGLPFQEGFAVERQGQAAEDQAGDEGQPLALFQLALLDEECAVDDQGADDQHRGGAVDASDSQLMTANVNDPWVDLENNEKQQERDEIDELFHSGSQKQDVAA